MRKMIPFCDTDITDLEIEKVVDTLKSGWITTGPNVKEFENRIAKYCGVEKAVCLNSATAAEELNLRICGIGEGDEVIVPAFTYSATVSSVIHCGAKVVMIDNAKDSPEMDFDLVAKAITPKTKAIVGVDYAGIVANYSRLYEIAESKKNMFSPLRGDSIGARIQQEKGRIIVIADGAHSFGASQNGIMSGNIADFTSFSFHSVKNLTTGEGGALTWKSIKGIEDEEIYKMYQLLSLHGQNKDSQAKNQLGGWEYDIIGTWYKCNMTNYTAAIGLGQLERYAGLLKRRKEMISLYNEAMDKCGIYRLKHYTDIDQSSGHLYITRIPGIDEIKRNEIIIKMAENGIACNVHYKPLPMMSAYKELGFDIKDYPNAYDYYKNLITLPLYTKLSNEDIEYIKDNYISIVKNLRE